MTVFASDDFENFPTGWTTAGGGTGTITKSAVQKHGGSYSCRIYSIDNTDQAWGSKVFTRLGTVNHHVRIWLYIDSSTIIDNDVLVMEVYDITAGKLSAITSLKYHDSAYYLRNNKTGSVEDVCTVSPNVWHQIDAYYNYTTGKIHYYVDEVKQGGDWDSYSGTGVRPEIIYIGDITTTTPFIGDGYIYLDDLIIDDATEITTVTRPYSIDALIKKLGLSKTDSIDALFMKLDITKTDSVDVLLKKFGVTKTYITDIALKKYGLSVTTPLDVIFGIGFTQIGRMNAVKHALMTKLLEVDPTFTVIDAWRMGTWQFSSFNGVLVSVKMNPSRLLKLNYGNEIVNMHEGVYFLYHFSLHILARYDFTREDELESITAYNKANAIATYLRANNKDPDSGIVDIVQLTARESDPSGGTTAGAHMARIILEGFILAERPFRLRS